MLLSLFRLLQILDNCCNVLQNLELSLGLNLRCSPFIPYSNDLIQTTIISCPGYNNSFLNKLFQTLVLCSFQCTQHSVTVFVLKQIFYQANTILSH